MKQKIYATKKRPATRRKTIKSKKDGSKLKFVWLITGIVFGGILSTIIFLNLTGAEISLQNPLKTHQAKKEKLKTKSTVQPKITKQAKIEPTKEKPQFRFYSELTKEDKVDNKQKNIHKSNQSNKNLSKKSGKNSDSSNTLTLKNIKKTQSIYSVQAGSFIKESDAEGLKAELALKGFGANVRSVKIQNGKKEQVWYRVSIGPFASLTEVQLQQKLLAESNVPGSLIIKDSG